MGSGRWQIGAGYPAQLEVGGVGESGGEREHEREATSDDDDEERKSHKGQEGTKKDFNDK